MRAFSASLLLSLLLSCWLALSTPALAQNRPSLPVPAETTQLSPQAAYREALHPLEATRANIANWSDAELAAMQVAVAQAKAGCDARKPEAYTGGDLVELARLCSLGQAWPAVVAAASRYIAASDASKPRLTDAYVAQTEALLRLKQEPAALQSALTMLKSVPYTTGVGDCVDEAVGYMRFVHTGDALALAEARQPLLLAALRASGTASEPMPPSVTSPPAAPAAVPSPAPYILYAQGLLLPALQQLAAQPAEAQASVSALDATLPLTLSPDDRLLIAREERGYALLGKPLQDIHPVKSLSMPYSRSPALPAQGAITAMLLLPDWCAQCVRLGPQLPSTVFTVEGHSAYVYALLAETVPQKRPDPKLSNAAFNPAYSAAAMAETPTVTVAPEMLNRFEAEAYPLLLLTDANGILRVLQPIGAADLQPGGDVDAAIALVGRNFSSSRPPATGTRASAPRP